MSRKVTRKDFLGMSALIAGAAAAPPLAKGSITAGKLAAFVLVEKDPHDVDPNTIKDIKVVRTVTGGRTVYPKREA